MPVLWNEPFGIVMAEAMASTRARMQLENQFMAALGSAKRLVSVGSGLRFENADKGDAAEFVLP